jgi:hypothetical protein
LKLFIICLITAVSGHVYANSRTSDSGIHRYDSLLPQRNYASLNADTFLELLDVENNFTEAGNAQKTMIKLLRIAGVKKSLRNNKLRARLFSDLANISTRLKLYPFAMKCYGLATRLNRKNVLSANDILYNPDTAGYSAFFASDTPGMTHLSSSLLLESLPILPADISCSFDDGKKAVSYAVIIHVKQPIRGRRKAFTGINNVGHTFITLIKLNDDNSSVSRSFGFYPAKKYLLSATPLHPQDNPVIKDDATHPWDETIGKFLSEKKFNKILDNLEKFSQTRYNLNRNNCTDFGLSEAIIAGFNIKETAGRWPLGRGNNPSNAGQSLLEGKFDNEDAEYPETLIVHEGQSINESNQ